LRKAAQKFCSTTARIAKLGLAYSNLQVVVPILSNCSRKGFLVVAATVPYMHVGGELTSLRVAPTTGSKLEEKPQPVFCKSFIRTLP
jgi:hypothetical protein